jgi:hypothetical protein
MTERMDHDAFRAPGTSSTEGGEPPGLLPGSQCPPPHRYWQAALTTGADALAPDERQHLSGCERCQEHLAQLARAVHFPCPEEAAALEEEVFGQDILTGKPETHVAAPAPRRLSPLLRFSVRVLNAVRRAAALRSGRGSAGGGSHRGA